MSQSELVHASIIEIRIGMPEPPEATQAVLTNKWVGVVDSSYRKNIVDEIIVQYDGIVGNKPGDASHLKFLFDRIVCFANMKTYDRMKERFPNAANTLIAGGLGENFVVDHEMLSPEHVCIGDIYRVNNVLLEISGPRAPCPKIDSWHNVHGLTAYCKETGYAGYFGRIIQEGTCRVNDTIELKSRVHPGYTLYYISSVLWGKEDQIFNEYMKQIKDGLLTDSQFVETILKARKEVLYYIMNMKQLLTRHYRDLAGTKYEKLMETISELNCSKECTTDQANNVDCEENTKVNVDINSNSSIDGNVWLHVIGGVAILYGVYLYFRHKR